MFELKIFESEQFRLIRTMVDDQTQEVVFNANDVTKTLGYVDVKQALRDHTKGGVVLTTPSPGGPQKMKYLTDPDLYRLIMALLTHTKCYRHQNFIVTNIDLF